MTEDDTFNVLRRIPYEQMHDLWYAELWLAQDNFYTQYGWTHEEFRIEYYKRYDNRR
jgi:hypothetical protein